nr:insecticidal toxin protein [Bacillus thuringiensis]
MIRFNNGGKVTPFGFDLPEESTTFKSIRSVLATNGRVLIAARTRFGQQLGGDVPSHCKTIYVANQLVNEPENSTNYEQQFLFFKTDNGDYRIANRQHGEVFQSNEATPELPPGDSLITAPYNNNRRQQFGKFLYADERFRIFNDDGSITPCGDKGNSWTKITMGANANEARYVFEYGDTSIPITIPTKLEPTTLGPIPELTNLDDFGKPPQPALVGSALLPCIFVNDRTPSQRIQDSPYYILECYDYWKLISSHVIPPNDTAQWMEETGVHSGVQDNMRQTIDMSIGSDKRLRYFNLSDPFRQSISRNINILRSDTGSDLSYTYGPNYHENKTSGQLRYAKYYVAREFVLKKSPNKDLK